MSRDEVSKLVQRDLQALDKIKDEAELKQAAATMQSNAVKSTPYREALESELAKHPAADTVTAMRPDQLSPSATRETFSYSRGRLCAELALDRAHEQLEAMAEDRRHLNTIVSRMENGLSRAAPQSEAETAEWAKLDAEALNNIKDANRRHFAILVMSGVADQKPEYMGALKAQNVDIAEQVEKVGKEERMLDAATNFEYAIERGLLVEKHFQEIEDHKRPAPTAEASVNSIEHDTEREVAQQPKIDDEVRRNVALMWLNRAKAAQLDTPEPRMPTDARQQPGTATPAAEFAATGTTSDKATVQPVPKEIEDTYLRVGNKYHYVKKPDLQAFEDKGNKLETKSNSEQIASDLVKIAAARGWEKIKVNGTDEFRQKVWLEASLQGMSVKGYTPSDADKALLEKRQRENPSNTIQRDDQAQQGKSTAPTLEKAPQAHTTPAQDRIDQGKVSAASNTKDSGTDKAKGLIGTLLEHGKANFNFDKDEKPNYYVKYRDDQGAEKIAWGVGLQNAIKESGAKIGDKIEMRNLGQKEVSVTANVRDADGKVVGTKEITTHRNVWEVKAEAFRNRDPQDAVKDHPDLVNAYAIIRAAELVAAQKFKSTEDQQRFVGMARESLAKQIEQNREIPQVRMKERQQPLQQRREAAIDEAER